MGEILVLETEPLNPVDGYAVTIVRSGTVVGHVPRNLSALFFHFLTRNGNKGVTEVTVYRLYGPNAYIQRLERAVEDIHT